MARGKLILSTERLLLQEFTVQDAKFILQLVNTPEWLKYIGDKNVHTIEDAENYLTTKLINSYEENGFGLYKVVLKKGKKAIGMCGLVNRPSLEDIDLGFAILPKYYRQGFTYEMAQATLDYAKQDLKIKKVVAITDVNNNASIQLLQKLGMQSSQNASEQSDDPILLFSHPEA